MLVLCGFALPSLCRFSVYCSFWVLAALTFAHWQEEQSWEGSYAGSSVVMDTVGFVLFTKNCSVLPAFLVPHDTEDVHGLHEITQLPQNLARSLTQICSDTNQSLWPLHNIRMFQLSRTPNYRWDESLKIDSALSGCFYLDSLGPAFKVSTLEPQSAHVPTWYSHEFPYTGSTHWTTAMNSESSLSAI